MNSLEALKEAALSLPKEYSTQDFLSFVNDSFKNYLQVIEKIDEGKIKEQIDSEKDKFKSVCGLLMESLNQLYLGFPNKSYLSFENGMKIIEEYLKKKSATHPLGESELFVRGRSSDSPLNKDRMFHLPFDLRHFASTQRFSIPGLPCLYLANSSYVCWEELDRPDYSKFYVSRYEIKKYEGYQFLRTLDISTTPQRIIRMVETVLKDFPNLDDWDSLFMQFFARWPLIFCCSIKVKYTTASFKPEYIVPQYLLQWIRENKNLNSIKYFSVKAHLNQNVDYSSFVNVVVPVQEIKTNGYCSKLSEFFSYSDPICLGDINGSKSPSKEDFQNYLEFRPEWTYLLQPLEGFGEKYSETIFGKADIELCKRSV